MQPAQTFRNASLCRIAITLFCVGLAHNSLNASARYTRSVAHYEAPDVTLVSIDGTRIALASALQHPGPVMLQFIFTTCPTICLVMSSTFSAAQSKLGADLAKVRMISISIDPEHDTPERLRQYARKFKAGPQWLFLTGKTEDIASVQKAFDAYRGSKMRHEPLTFLRGAPSESWVRLDGLMSATELVDEYKQLYARMKPDAELGRRIYREGFLPSGKPVRAVVQGDVRVEGTQLNCANCHRRSGFGSSEGAAFVPPVTGSFLFGGRELRRTDFFRKLFQEVQPNRVRARLRDPRVRQAYTDETFAFALREGKDPLGREFDLLMPRYDLSDEDTAHVIAYLKSLGGTAASGVTRSAIHFATIFTEGVEPEKRRAMLEVMDAYFRWKNADTRGLLKRPGHAAFYDANSYDALREWVLHVWELKGPVATWPMQLADYYRKQPVFALLGGVGEGSWRPVHDFCEQQEVPCVFPNTNLPVLSPVGSYSIYLSGGVAVEAASLARHLGQTVVSVERTRPTRIVQVYRDFDRGLVLAGALRRTLQEQVGVDLRDCVVHRAQKPSPDFWKKLLKDEGDERHLTLVLWLGEADLESLAGAQIPADRVRQIYLSYSLLKTLRSPLPENFRDKTFLTYPFTLPEAPRPHAYRARAWLRSRGVVRVYDLIQLNTYFMLTVADHSLANLTGNFSRDYFVESIEHETESTPNPGVFPRLSLGPGQRFASKGSYIVKVSGEVIEAASDWIIP
jgi:cytochrome oxidase Cu insertion factor (SCO1/SenC/PrrC family)